MDYNRLIRLASRAGQIILESGGETYRVEETIIKILNSYDVGLSESFVTPTGIMVSIIGPGGEIVSLITRVKRLSTNLEKVHHVNALSRSIAENPMSLDELSTELARIEDIREYSLPMQLLFSAVLGFGFTMLYGGSIASGFAAAVVAPGARLIQHYSRSYNLNGIFINILAGAFVSAASYGLMTLGFGIDFDTVLLGSIMLLVPGIAITNAIRDTLFGDYVSGLARFVEAVLTALGIAVGTGLGLLIFR